VAYNGRVILNQFKKSDKGYTFKFKTSVRFSTILKKIVKFQEDQKHFFKVYFNIIFFASHSTFKTQKPDGLLNYIIT